MGLFRNLKHLLAALFNDRAQFNRQWNEPAARSLPEGRWHGEWLSEANGHHGALRCILIKAKPDEYQAMFHAVYARFLSVAYTVPLHGHLVDGKLKLQGETDLGKLAGGVYEYKGEADETAFRCTYRCAYDHGTFQLAPFGKLAEDVR